MSSEAAPLSTSTHDAPVEKSARAPRAGSKKPGSRSSSALGRGTPEHRAEVAERRASLFTEQSQDEAKQVRGRWVTDKQALRRNKDLRFREKLNRAAPRRLAKMELLKEEDDSARGLITEDGEVTDKVTQDEIYAQVDMQTQQKRFDLRLDLLGPYMVDFSHNGSHMAFAGLRGHVANMKWGTFDLEGETFLKDKCTDIKLLVDHSMMAVAQSKFVYMYTKDGTEMHVLPKFANVNKLGYLPRHLLLVGTSSTYSMMQYMDISTGLELGTKPPSVMHDPTASLAVNPQNGVVATGDTRGVIKMWSPTVVDPLVQIKAHRGPVRHLAFHPEGRFAVSMGASDNKMKLWDLRTLRALDEYHVSYCVDAMDVSQHGHIALAGGATVQVWRDMFSRARPFRPWMKHSLGYGNVVSSAKFCPFEDILALGHLHGVSTMIVPSAGEANPDFFDANPYETELHRKDRVVRQLLDKLAPETISLDLQIANVDEKRLSEYQAALEANRKARNIREKKQRKVETLGDAAPSGLAKAYASGEVDEVDEQLGTVERGVTREWKSKKELEKERKMKRWDERDTADKIRSKQTMRHSKQVQSQRKKNRYEEQKAEMDKEGGATSDAPVDAAGRPVRESAGARRARSASANAASVAAARTEAARIVTAANAAPVDPDAAQRKQSRKAAKAADPEQQQRKELRRSASTNAALSKLF
jgi:hypothetical protein